MAEPKVLLTVSGDIPEDLDDEIAAGRRPRADYREIAARLGADVVDRRAGLAACGRVGRVLDRIGGAGLLLAWYCARRRRDYDVVITDGEQVGLPLAVWCRCFGRRRARHVMIVHIVSVPKKELLLRRFRLGPMIDRYLVYASAQRDALVGRLGVDEQQVVLIPFMVDTSFFAPGASGADRRRMICSAGLERRDYPTMMDAVDGLDVEVVIAAASPWSKQPDSSSGRALPANVEIRRLDLHQLRRLYDECAFVVIPLVEVDFQAGITSILEAMAMGRGVVCTRTAGQTDTIVADETGWYVAPGDAGALRERIVTLLDDPDELQRVGDAARRWVVEEADIEVYADRIAEVVRQVAGGPGSGRG